MLWLAKFTMAASAVALLAGCQSPGYVGSITSAQFERTSEAQIVTASMPTYQQVTAPFGYVGFCVRNPDECEGGTDAPQAAVMTPEKWAELNKVNDYVNSAVPQVSDVALYDRDEWWAYPDARGGDCEDLAMMKRKLLIERGWAAENLLISVVREWNGDGHAVLIVTTDRGEFVLDNKNWEIVAWSDAPYQWIKRQSRERPFIWVNLDRRTMRTAEIQFPPVGEQAPFLAVLQKKDQPALRPGIANGQTASRSLPKEKATAAIN
jgi:predicted transglutaminase-like cysteine proteinase